jgi:enoyl-CoA hydratase
MDGEIRVTRKDPVITVTFSRPEKLNSITREMLYDFSDKVSKLTNDPDILAIIFTGEGQKSFSSGFDLKMIKSLEEQDLYDFFKKLESTIRSIRQTRNCLTIAAVNGYAIGFGAMVATACDFRFFSKNAVYRLPEIDVDVFPGAGAASNLIQLVGPAHTKDILLTGRTVSAEECYRIGLADRIFEPDDLIAKTSEFIEELLKKDKIIMLRTKTMVDGMTSRTIQGADEEETMFLDEWLHERKQ